MDIKKIVSELVEKIQSNPKLLQQFKSNPIKVVEQLAGIDLPDDMIRQVADLVKAKIDLDKAGDLLEGLGSLFGKK